MLKRALLVLGGAAGLVAGREVLQRSSASTSETLTFEGRGWHIYSRELAKGRLPAGGERMVAYGDLHATAADERAGGFFATYFSIPEAGSGGRFASIEHHTFNLADGSIMGTGTTQPGLDSQDEFAIVGGTGRYAGARGTYTVRQSHQEFGGDGTALITFKLITEAPDHGTV
jgi:hypothetical protein